MSISKRYFEQLQKFAESDTYKEKYPHIVDTIYALQETLEDTTGPHNIERINKELAPFVREIKETGVELEGDDVLINRTIQNIGEGSLSKKIKEGKEFAVCILHQENDIQGRSKVIGPALDIGDLPIPKDNIITKKEIPKEGITTYIKCTPRSHEQKKQEGKLAHAVYDFSLVQIEKPKSNTLINDSIYNVKEKISPIEQENLLTQAKKRLR